MNDVTAIELISEALVKAEKHEVFNKMETVSVNSALIHLTNKINAEKEQEDDKSKTLEANGAAKNKHRQS